MWADCARWQNLQQSEEAGSQAGPLGPLAHAGCLMQDAGAASECSRMKYLDGIGAVFQIV